MVMRAGAAAGAGQFAHVLARTTFGPYPGQVAAALERAPTAAALVDQLLAAPPLPFDPPVDIDAANSEDVRLWMGFRQWWVDRMLRDDAGLHERMMWFWHGLFTTSWNKVDDTNLCWRQLRTLHQHALGNLGDLAKALTVDGAMLRYLDGQDSIASDPNENYGRELMELFLLGIGNYTQADVVAAARSLAGWRIDLVDGRVYQEPSWTLSEPVEFLGDRRQFDVAGIVDRILQQDACAPFVVGRVWDVFVGGERDTDLIRGWADRFRASGYEIAPLMAEVLHSDAFLNARRTRASTPLEWYLGAIRATGEPTERSVERLAGLGQEPYLPPSVAGWPIGDEWLNPTQFRSRSNTLATFTFPAADEVGAAESPADAALGRCSLVDASDATRSTVADLAAQLAADPTIDAHGRGTALLAAALLSPEASLR
jgi:uncharacterized protein (DUF1800 family)